MPYQNVIVVPGYFEPPAGAPTADATAEQHAAQQFGNGHLPHQLLSAGAVVVALVGSFFTEVPEASAEQHAAQQFGNQPSIIAHLPDHTSVVLPPPLLDTTDQESVARQYGNDPPILQFLPDWTLSVDGWLGAPEADATAEQSAARQYGNDPPILRWSERAQPPSEIAEPPWFPILPTDNTVPERDNVWRPVIDARPFIPFLPDWSFQAFPVPGYPATDTTAEQHAAQQFGNGGAPLILRWSDTFPPPGTSAEPAWPAILATLSAEVSPYRIFDEYPPHLLLVDCSAGTVTSQVLTLPSIAVDGVRHYWVKRTDNTAGRTLTIVANAADTIEGAATLVLADQYDSVELLSDRVNRWYIIASRGI